MTQCFQKACFSEASKGVIVSEWVKRLGKKEKMPIYSIFSVGLSPIQALVFTCLRYKSFENALGKGEIARNEEFLLIPQCFLSIWRTFCHFHQI